MDDNRDGAERWPMMLRLLGNEVRTAHDGVEAVEQAEAFRPEVILMDVGMPRLNGLDATRRIREQPWGRARAVIALTGWGQDADRDRSRGGRVRRPPGEAGEPGRPHPSDGRVADLIGRRGMRRA